MAKDLLGRLADAGEDALGKLAQAPGMNRVVGSAGQLAELLDDLQKRLRGIDTLTSRLEALERRVDELEGRSTSAVAAQPVSSPPPPPPPAVKPHPRAEAATEAKPVAEPGTHGRDTVTQEPEEPGQLPGP
jgi:hypothetical protein